MLSKEMLENILWYTMTLHTDLGTYSDIVTIKYRSGWFTRTKKFKFQRNGLYNYAESPRATELYNQIEEFMNNKIETTSSMEIE
jgi:hypothetical protein